MFQKLDINMRKVYPALVVSTMSSGKSTLINAFLGKELMPSRNRACTAKIFALLDNDKMDSFRAHIITGKDTYKLVENIDKKTINKYNEQKNTKEFIIEGQIKGVKNSKKALLLIDTPGINNSMDTSHKKITDSIFDKCKEGLIIYLINASQMGTYDDEIFLKMVSKKLKNNDKFNIIFVVNKMDLIDPIKESPDGLILNCKNYIESKGIKDPIIVSTAARSALLFKKVINGLELSEMEEEDFDREFKRFKNKGHSLLHYQSRPSLKDMRDVLEVDGKEYRVADIYSALYNTGILQLESLIDEMMVYSLKMKAPKVKKKKEEYFNPKLGLKGTYFP